MTIVAGVVLAGGRASRMGGGDKPLLELAGRPLAAHILAAIRPETQVLAISGNVDPTRYAGFGLPLLPDGEFFGCGPLAGVLAGMEWAAGQGARLLLTVPGDTPFLPAHLVGRLMPAPACASSLGRAHPLVALWPVGVAALLRDFLVSTPESRSVRRFGDRIGLRAVPFSARPGQDPFFNVNTPIDLASAARSVLAANPHSG